MKTSTSISSNERLRMIANLIIDRILEEQGSGKLEKLVKLKSDNYE